ncbi:hypothetical protein GCM10009539_34140 [Cryptosporangium japonicum]|uniref:Uncharacterized protein n=1 Tax=Cryptosporangium japonicum TaxID=80872 RepID=A0ABP3E090_9ACTN
MDLHCDCVEYVPPYTHCAADAAGGAMLIAPPSNNAGTAIRAIHRFIVASYTVFRLWRFPLVIGFRAPAKHGHTVRCGHLRQS